MVAAQLRFFVFSPEPQAVELNHTQGETSTSINPFQTHRPEGSRDMIKLPTNINHQRAFFFSQGLQGQFNASRWEISQHEVTAASTEVSFPSPQPSASDSKDLCRKTSVPNMSDQHFRLKHLQHFRSPSKRGASPFSTFSALTLASISSNHS